MVINLIKIYLDQYCFFFPKGLMLDIFDFVCFLFDFTSNIVDLFNFWSREASFECFWEILIVRNPNSLNKINNLNKRMIRFYRKPVLLCLWVFADFFNVYFYLCRRCFYRKNSWDNLCIEFLRVLSVCAVDNSGNRVLLVWFHRGSWNPFSFSLF